MTTYFNPYHKPGKPEYGPEEFTTDASPKHYNGFDIYERIKGQVWDVVNPQNNTVVTQRAGPRGARDAIDDLK